MRDYAHRWLCCYGTAKNFDETILQASELHYTGYKPHPLTNVVEAKKFNFDKILVYCLKV